MSPPGTKAVSRGLSGPVRGALWMTGAAVSLVVMALTVRYLAARVHVLEQIFLRSVVNLALLTPWMVAVGFASLKTRRLGGHGLRNVFLYGANVAWYFSVPVVALADLAALQFTQPLFTVVLAALVLREVVGGHRWIATAVGFAGALVIVRPGFEVVDGGTMLVLLASLLYAAAFIVTKSLADTESGNRVVFYMTLFVLVFSFVPAMFVWVTPAWSDVPAIVLLGITGYSTHYCTTRAMAAADASFVSPFDFLRLPLSALAGIYIYMEKLDPLTVAGALIIFGAAYYNTRQEGRATARA